MLRDTATKCSYHHAENSSRYSSFWTCVAGLGWWYFEAHSMAAWRAAKICPVNFCALITVYPMQSQDVRLRWGRALALVP